MSICGCADVRVRPPVRVVRKRSWLCAQALPQGRQAFSFTVPVYKGSGELSGISLYSSGLRFRLREVTRGFVCGQRGRGSAGVVHRKGQAPLNVPLI